MAFQKRRISSTDTKRRNSKRYKTSTQKKNIKKWVRSIIWKIFLYWFFGFSFALILWAFVLYQKIIAPLPDVNELENLDIAESSIIYDNEWGELYKIFQEKRTYKRFNDINENIINALVAGEDQRYWENPGVDFIGLIRAGIYWVIGKNEGFWGTSTLTQQLIRNTIIENRSSNESIFDKLERKIKEIYLAFRLTNDVSKEKIIELYLNKIAYGSNAFGIEQAAQTFFDMSAKDAWVLEWAILASLPKGPSYYSPYSNFDRLMGYPYIYAGDDSESPVNLITPSSIGENTEDVNNLKEFINSWKLQRFSDSKALICGLDAEKLKSNISIDKDGCSVLDYSEMLVLLNAIKIRWWENTIEYQTGRKDFILGRMLEDDYITFDQYRESLIASIGFEFSTYREDIKYPHFVFYVREYLEEKYGKDILETGWLRIYTSIDPVLQDKAEQLVEKYWSSNEFKFGAQNASLISLDNETWEIIAMVGWRDYFDEENKWNVNITTSKLQPGSTFKSFVYSMAIDKEIIGSKTPVYDVKTTFPGWYAPNNFDGDFMGKMDISKALNYSRNVPAVKMFYLAGWENEIIKWMEKLWVSSMQSFKDEYFETYWVEYSYGASMALGTALMTPLELATAYSVYANLWLKKEIVPVTKILDSQGLIIEEYNPEDNLWERVMDASTAFITNFILSDTWSRPDFWNTYLSLRWRKMAAKTGTSTKQYEQWWEKIIAPSNLWTIWYTPQATTIVWAGNNDGQQTNFDGNGLEAAGPIMKDFMEFYHSDEPILDWKRPNWVKEVSMSELSWELASETLPSDLISSSLFVNVPRRVDNSLKDIQVDLLCNGIVDEQTPISAIWNVSFLSLNSLRPDNPAWENPVQTYIANGWVDNIIPNASKYITKISDEICLRENFAWAIEVGSSIKSWDTLVNGSNFIEIGYRSSSPITKIEVYLDEIQVGNFPILAWSNNGLYTGNINVPMWTIGQRDLTIRAIDNEYYAQGVSYSINVIKSDETPPVITLTNPSDGKISLYEWNFFNLRWTIEDRWAIKSINIYVDNTPVKIGMSGREFTQEITTENLVVGNYKIIIEAIDSDFNTWVASVDLEVLPG